MQTRFRDVENIADFSRYYAHAWVGYHDSASNNVIPATVGGLVTNESVGLRFLSKLEDGKWALSPTWQTRTLSQLDKSIDYGKPDIGMSEDGPTVVYLAHATPRAPSKGLRPRDARVTTFNDYDIRGLRTDRVSERYDWVWHCFNPKYSTFREALQILDSGQKVGIALSKNFGAYTSKEAKYPALAYKRWTIGYIPNNSEVVLNPIYLEYVPEIEKTLEIKVRGY